MNARQAAKKWKRMYKELASKPIPKVYVAPRRIAKLQSVKTVKGRDVYTNMLTAETMISESFIRDLCKEIIKYCEIETFYDYTWDEYRVRATCEVLDNGWKKLGRMFSNEPIENVVLKVAEE